MCVVSDLLNPHTVSATTTIELPVNEETVNVRRISINNNDGEYIIRPVSIIDFVQKYKADLIHCQVKYLHHNGTISTTKSLDKFYKLPGHTNEVYEAELYFLEDELGVTGRGSNTYKYLCKLVKERDGKCLICGKAGELQCHHIMGYKDYPGLQANLGNCVSLCPDCHREYHEAYEEVNNYTWSKFLMRKCSELTSHCILSSMSTVYDDEQSLILKGVGD